MSRSIRVAFVGALALAAASLSAAPASALPAPAPLTAMSPASGVAVEQVRFVHRGFGYRRPFHRRGFGYRRGLPGHPIRRILRHL